MANAAKIFVQFEADFDGSTIGLAFMTNLEGKGLTFFFYFHDNLLKSFLAVF